MSKNTIKINPTKTNQVDFNVNVDGVDDRPSVLLSVQLPDYNLVFECKKNGATDKWTATIPPIDALTASSYDFTISVIVDGYYFEAASGKITTTPKITASVATEAVISSVTAQPVVSVEEAMADPTERIQSPSLTESKSTEPQKPLLAGVSKPSAPGSLFSRDKTGKVVVEGLEPESVRAKKAQKAEVVRGILSNHNPDTF